MKKTILVVSAILLGISQINAQVEKGNSFILITLNSPMKNNQLHNPHNVFINESGGNYTYVSAKNETYAIRYGIGISNRVIHQSIMKNIKNDTTFYTSYYKESTMPYISLGKEWRKILHPDVMIIGGGDISLGGGGIKNKSFSSNETDEYTNIKSSTWKSGGAVFAAFTPFMGVRVSWKRLAIGYSASIPIEAIATFGDATTTNRIEIKGLSHNISAGYRIYNR